MAREIMEARLAKLGFSPTASVKDGDELVIRGPGVGNPVALANVIKVTGQLQVFDFEPSLQSGSLPYTFKQVARSSCSR